MLIATTSGPPGVTKTSRSWNPASLRSVGTNFCSISFVNSWDAFGFRVNETMRVYMRLLAAGRFGSRVNLLSALARGDGRPVKGSARPQACRALLSTCRSVRAIRRHQLAPPEADHVAEGSAGEPVAHRMLRRDLLPAAMLQDDARSALGALEGHLDL